MNVQRRSWIAASFVCSAVLIASATVGAATIAGTAGSDTLRGTPGADRLTGKGGNDKLYGTAGNDVLSGGAGNDVLVGGPGADTLSCGAGRDTARGDARDKVGRDCEAVTGVPKPEPPAPQPPAPPEPPAAPAPVAVTAGNYQGQINQGNFLFFEIAGDRTVRNWRTNEIPEECDNGALLRGGFWAVYGNPVPIANDGSFLIDWTGTLTFDEGPVTFQVRIAGRVEGSSASGTVRSSSEFTYEGERFKCASADLPWAATHRP